jgi:hypothetical protein
MTATRKRLLSKTAIFEGLSGSANLTRSDIKRPLSKKTDFRRMRLAA